MEEGAAVRALVVDDSAFMRKVVSDILRGGGVEVVGTARDGREGLDAAARLRPDVLIIDVEMPVMDGVALLTELMRTAATPVVVLSSLTETGAETTIRCLELGAVACIRKPSGSISLDIESIGAEIVATVKSAANADPRRLRSAAAAGALRRYVASDQPVPACGPMAPTDALVVIASSTGGPGALQLVVPLLPADLPAAVVIVQHLPVGFTGPLAERLDHSSQLAVREAADGDELKRGLVLVAPAGSHAEIRDAGRIRLNQDPPMWGVRPAADVTLRSAAGRLGGRVVGVVLTGMGRDGALGAKAVHDSGGVCLAQDEATSVVWGMPRSAVEAGAADRVLPIDEVADAIARSVLNIKMRGSAFDGRESRTIRDTAGGLRRVPAPGP